MTGLVVPTSLVRELGRSWADCAGSEGREDCLRTLGLLVVVRVWPAPALLREDGFLVRVEAVVLVRPVELVPVPNRAEDACVGAVAEAGNRTGLVGDFVRGLVAWEFVGEAFGPSCDSVEPRAVRAEVFAAGFKEARLGL